MTDPPRCHVCRRPVRSTCAHSMSELRRSASEYPNKETQP